MVQYCLKNNGFLLIISSAVFVVTHQEEFLCHHRTGSCTVSSKTKSLLTRHSILRFKFKVEFFKMARWTLLQDRTEELTYRYVLDKMHLQNLNCPSVNVLSSLDHRRSQKIWFTVLVASLKQGSGMRCVTFTPMTYLASQIVFYVKKRERDRGSCVFMLLRVGITTENKASQRQVRFCWFSSVRRSTGNMVEGTGVEWEWRGGVCGCVHVYTLGVKSAKICLVFHYCLCMCGSYQSDTWCP